MVILQETGRRSIKGQQWQFCSMRLVVAMAAAMLLGRTGAGSAADTPTGRDWVIYATAPGWLRLGPRAEYLAPMKVRDEIWGGPSEVPLAKSLLAEGFAGREEALRQLCDNLTLVTVQYDATGTPHEFTSGIYQGKAYFLRLDRGVDPEAVLATGQQYDLAAEKRVLAAHGLTPRMSFGRLWLIHATGHGTTEGGQRDDRWLTFSQAPSPDPANPGRGRFWMADGGGGTVGYTTDRWDGPYRDNFGMARAMRRLGVPQVDLWPPGNSYTRQVVAAEVPDQPSDFGAAAAGVQPIIDGPELRDWVVYVTANRWLHIGSRQEFVAPVKARDTIWGGTSDDLVTKSEVPLGKHFTAYDEALLYLCRALTNVHTGFNPGNQPLETVEATLNGHDYTLQVARDATALVAAYGGYDYASEMQVMLAQGIVPRKTFRKQWLVHATGHGTSSGGVRDDRWMLVADQPQNGAVQIPDGMGGTFGYSVDAVEGPFEDNVALVPVLRRHNIDSSRLAGEDRYVTVNDAVAAQPPRELPPHILSVSPAEGEPGQRFYVTVVADGMKPWYHLKLGPGVTVSNETYLGKNPDGEGERWLATVTIADNAAPD